MISLPRPPSKHLISKPEPSINIQELLGSGFTKTHIDFALKLSRDKSEVGIINWMLDNPEQKVIDNIKAGRISDPFAEAADLSNNTFVNLEGKIEYLQPNESQFPLSKEVESNDPFIALDGKIEYMKPAVSKPFVRDVIQETGSMNLFSSHALEKRVKYQKTRFTNLEKDVIAMKADEDKPNNFAISAGSKNLAKDAIQETGAMNLFSKHALEKKVKKIALGSNPKYLEDDERLAKLEQCIIAMKADANKPNKIAISKRVRFEEKKRPEDDEQATNKKLEKAVQQFYSSRNWINLKQHNYHLALNSSEQLQVHNFLIQLRRENRNPSYHDKLEGFNQVMATLQEPLYGKLVKYLQTDTHESLQKLRNRIYENLCNVFYCYFTTEGKLGEISELGLSEAFTTLANTVSFTYRQVSKLYDMYSEYERKRKIISRKLMLEMQKKAEPHPIALNGQNLKHGNKKAKKKKLKEAPIKQATVEKQIEKQPESRLTDYEACVVCMDQLRNHVFIPCRHLLTCHKCVALFKACPVCQAQIVEKIQIRWCAEY